MHHGLTGLVLATFGIALMIDDALDWRHWIADFQTPHRDRDSRRAT